MLASLGIQESWLAGRGQGGRRRPGNFPGDPPVAWRSETRLPGHSGPRGKHGRVRAVAEWNVNARSEGTMNTAVTGTGRGWFTASLPGGAQPRSRDPPPLPDPPPGARARLVLSAGSPVWSAGGTRVGTEPASRSAWQRPGCAFPLFIFIFHLFHF